MAGNDVMRHAMLPMRPMKMAKMTLAMQVLIIRTMMKIMSMHMAMITKILPVITEVMVTYCKAHDWPRLLSPPPQRRAKHIARTHPTHKDSRKSRERDAFWPKMSTASR